VNFRHRPFPPRQRSARGQTQRKAVSIPHSSPGNAQSSFAQEVPLHNLLEVKGGNTRASGVAGRTMEGRVVRMSVAPVKALGLLHPSEVVVGASGVVGNRRFWLRDEHGKLFNAKREGLLLQIRPEWDESSRRLALTFPDGRRVDAIVELAEQIDAMMYGELRSSRRVVGPWQDAISEFIGRRLEFLWADDGSVDRLTSNGTVSLVSMASLARLQKEMGSDRPLDGRRFRMLFEIEGVGANEEDAWIGRHVQVGDAELVFHGDIGRCIVTSRDPDTGDVDLPTLITLAAYRREGVSEPLPLGIKGTVYTPGRVRLGDTARPL
jgi:uncharacterized protein